MGQSNLYDNLRKFVFNRQIHITPPQRPNTDNFLLALAKKNYELEDTILNIRIVKGRVVRVENPNHE